MINRYSSRKEKLDESFLNKKLKNAKSYDRIAGYFRSSILELSGEDLENIEGKVRVICNSDLNIEDVKTAIAAQNAMRKDWCSNNPEEEYKNIPKKLVKLYNLLKSKKLEIRVMPNEAFGLIHGKAGVITFKDDTKTSFIGSIKESYSAFKINYEMIWEDDSDEAVKWVQDEFNSLWNSKYAVPLCDFIIEDIKRISSRERIDKIDDWKKECNPAEVVVESSVYRKELGLWNHQKYFVNLAFNEHKKSYGARYILADMVGLGKTVQLALSAQLMALYGNKPVLVIAPKTLIWQWQEEINSLLDMPSAVWDGKDWIDENGIKHVSSDISCIKKCPRRVGIISQGLITSNSPITEKLLEIEYECIIVDECHRARRKNLSQNKMDQKADPNNLMKFLLQISRNTKSMLLATATPVQLYPIEAYDLMSILAQKNDSVLGSVLSQWRTYPDKGLDLVMGKEVLKRQSEIFEWVRDPFPPSSEDRNFERIRRSVELKDDKFILKHSDKDKLRKPDLSRLERLIQGDYIQNYNPYIRHIVRRTRDYLETTINPETNECSVVIEESPKYHMLSYVASIPKDGEKFSGDSFNFGKNKNGIYVIALSDGMGSGPDAGLESSVAIDIIDEFIKCGYDEEIAIKAINSIMNMKFSEDEKFTTLDMSMVDLYSGELSVIKAGAVATFIKRYEDVQVISDNSLPFGAVEEIEYKKKKKKLKHGDIVITISDGILDVDKNNIGDYSWLRTYLEKATTNPEQLSRDILDKAKELSNGKVMDDMTVVVSKLYSLY